MPGRRCPRRRTLRLRMIAVAAGCGIAAAACSTYAPGASHPATPGSSVHDADEQMPSAPSDSTTWLALVDRIFGHADNGRSADKWLRHRMANRRPGERLAVVLGIDDVMLQTHFAGLDTLVPR